MSTLPACPLCKSTFTYEDGASLVVKVGTRVKNIKLVDGDHDIDCKIEGNGR